VLEATEIGIELVTRNESGSDPAGNRLQLVVTNQAANVVLGAAELGRDLADCQRCGPLHPRSIARGRTDGLAPSDDPLAQSTRSRNLVPGLNQVAEFRRSRRFRAN
jgi:hypothetical protein